IAVAIVWLAAGSACGKKGDPRAPELATPKVITNLSARVDQTGVVLTWSRPTEYVDGTALKDLAGFVIFRKDISPSCLDCPVPYGAGNCFARCERLPIRRRLCSRESARRRTRSSTRSSREF